MSQDWLSRPGLKLDEVDFLASEDFLNVSLNSSGLKTELDLPVPKSKPCIALPASSLDIMV